MTRFPQPELDELQAQIDTVGLLAASPVPKQHGHMTARGSSAIDGFGLLAQTSSSFGGLGVDDTGAFARFVTSGSGADSDAARSTAQSAALDAKPLLYIKFALFLGTSNRLFVGFGNAVSPASTDDVQNAIGLQKRAGDTNWFFYTNAADGSATRVDTGVAVSTDPFTLIIDVESASSVILRLLNSAGVQVATTTFTTDLVAGATGLYTVWSVFETAASVTNLDCYWADLELRP